VNGSPQSTTIGANGSVQSAPLRNNGTAPGAGESRGNGIFQQSPKESKIGFETRTPTPFGEARTVVEIDFAGSSTFAPGGTTATSTTDSLVPRLRYAYGTLGGLLAGQATSNFSDPDANSEDIDFGGNVGEPGVTRIPQVRYTMPAWWGGSFSVSAETPATDIGTGAGVEYSDAGVVPTVGTACTITALGTATTCTTALATSGSTFLGTTNINAAKASAPDLTAAYYIPQPWGHFDLSAVLRPGLDVEDGKYFAKDYIGYGGHVGLDFKPGWFGWAKDDIALHFEAGEGIGRYINSSTNFALATNYGAAGQYGSFNGPTTAASAALIQVRPTAEMGGELGYQHWWLDNLRSNINAGINIHNIPGALIGASQAAAQNKELFTAHANIIWNPVSTVDIGLEYFYGYRQVVNGLNGNVNTLISEFKFRF
jgi:hypothetical protein